MDKSKLDSPFKTVFYTLRSMRTLNRMLSPEFNYAVGEFEITFRPGEHSFQTASIPYETAYKGVFTHARGGSYRVLAQVYAEPVKDNMTRIELRVFMSPLFWIPLMLVGSLSTLATCMATCRAPVPGIFFLGFFIAIITTNYQRSLQVRRKALEEIIKLIGQDKRHEPFIYFDSER